ncbi:MAG: hypothetical protein R3E91_05700 [Chlamydiales bacterium]
MSHSSQSDLRELEAMTKNYLECLLEIDGIPSNQRAEQLGKIRMIVNSTLLFIGIAAAYGYFAGLPLGISTIALSGLSFVFTLAMGEFKKRKIYLIFQTLLMISFIVLGSMHISGFITVTQLGKSLIGSPFFCLCISEIFRKCCKEHTREKIDINQSFNSN